MKSNNLRMLSGQSMLRTLHKLEQKPLNLMEQVKCQVATLTKKQRDEFLAPYHAAVAALQFGRFTDVDFRMLADAFNVAETLAKPPFNLANDHADKFQDGLQALEQLAGQYNERKSWTARAAQLQAVKDAMEMHEIQLQFVSQAELLDAAARVVLRARAALAGNGSGCTVVEVLA